MKEEKASAATFPAITPLLQFIEPGMVGAEIGVQQALSSIAILAAGVEKLLCVDPWKVYSGYGEVEGWPDAQLEAWKKVALKNLRPFLDDGMAQVLIMPSSEAVVETYLQTGLTDGVPVVPATYDFVFIDGNHSLEYTWRDIFMWWPRVRPGGFICGHDYLIEGPHHQVGRAVRAWADRAAIMGLEIEEHGDCWMIRKPLGTTVPPKTIDLVMFTMNRSEYTKMTLDSLAETASGVDWGAVNFVVIDHGSTDDTVNVLGDFIREHPGIISYIEMAGENRGVANGFEYFRKHYTTPKAIAGVIGKIDNDSIFTKGWLRKMFDCLDAHPKLGIVGAQEGYGANWKVEPPEGYFRVNHVGGRFLARKGIFPSAPTLRGKGVWGWSEFQMKLSKAGRWDIGWCWPSAVIEHVGDWGENHPQAIKNAEYQDYMRKVRGGQYKK